MENILNVYVQALVTEVWTTLGPEFGKDARKIAYGLKSAIAAFRSHLARCMESLGYESCQADHDLWLKPEIRLEGGVQH